MAKTARMTASERDAYTRGRSCFESGDDDHAFEALSSVLEARQNFADVHYMLGVLLERKGELEQALSRLRQAVRLNPAYAEALLALATIYERTGNFEASREISERAAKLPRSEPGTLDPTTHGKLANLQAALGRAYADVGEWRDAIDAYRRALDRCPEYHDIRSLLGVALREAGLPDRAVKEFERVLRGNPRMLGSRIQLGLTYYRLGRTPAAITEWKTVLKLDPTREDARMYLRLIGAPS